jgi:hypothetical protein
MFGRAQVPLHLVSGEPGRLRTLHELLHPLHLVQESHHPVPEVMVPASLPESGRRSGDGPHRYAGKGAPAQVHENGTAHEKRDPAPRYGDEDRSQNQDLDRGDPGPAVRRFDPARLSDSCLRTKKTGRWGPMRIQRPCQGAGTRERKEREGLRGFSGVPERGKLSRLRKILPDGGVGGGSEGPRPSSLPESLQRHHRVPDPPQ